MFDRRARPVLARVIGPVSAELRVEPLVFTGLGLLAGLGSAVAAGLSAWTIALVLWLGGRVLDAMDGAVARSTDKVTDRGGYLDFCADMAVYVAVPIGIGVGRSDETVWAFVAFVLGSFAFNAVSLSHLAALLEKRGLGAATTAESTSVTMPQGLIEGVETILFFSVALAIPSRVAWVFGIMGGLVLVGAIHRITLGARLLR